MKERQEGCRTRRTSTCRSRVITACLVLALAVGVAGFCLTEEEAQKVQRTGCIEAEKIRIPGRETMVLNPLREETADSRLGSAVKNYYEGLAKETDFTEGYEDIRACVKDGAYKDTYVVFARYEMKIKDIYTKVPGLETLYVRKDNRSGAYRILTEHLDEDTKDYIQTVAGHQDVRELLAQMEEEYQEALASDALLKESLEDLKKAYEGSAAGE